MDPAFVERLRAVTGASFVRTDAETLRVYGMDALRRGHPPDVVVSPGSTHEIAAILRLCDESRTPITPRGAGTGYSGGAVPSRGGVVLSLERLNRIVEIDEANLLAVVEPNVITGDLQDAVERVGLFYPPDPASLRQCAIGGNVAECAGGPRAFKYGVTRQYVLGLEAVLPTGEIIRTGGRVVKSVAGYDLTRLLVGSEGTLAIVTEILLRLVPKPPAAATVRATFATIADAVAAVTRLVRARVVPATLELIDRESLDAVSSTLEDWTLAPRGTEALLLLEVDGLPAQVAEEAALLEQACRDAGALDVRRATDAAEREDLWRVRREISLSLQRIAPVKFNHDVVVPRARIPELFDVVAALKAEFGLPIPSFGHAGDGNIHVNIMCDDAPEPLGRARAAERALFERVIALGGSITGEHGVGFSKAQYLDLELSPATIALMKRVKQAFDPHGILNPGKMFPDEVRVPDVT